MMGKFTYRTLIWIIVILLATNLSMGVSFLYHKQQDKKFMEQMEETAIKVPSEMRTRFFREQLNLRQDQMDIFRELNSVDADAFIIKKMVWPQRGEGRWFGFRSCP